MLDGALAQRSPGKGRKGAKQTLLRKCTNFTGAHPYTHAHLWIGKSTWPQGPQKLEEGMAACNVAFATDPLLIGKALD